MKLGILKDIKKGEYRVIFTPGEAAACIDDGHEVLVEKDAGAAAGFFNEEYEAVGAQISDRDTIFATCDVVAKVKEIEPSEYDLLRENQMLKLCVFVNHI